MVRSGFSLIEVIIAMLLLSIALLGVAGSGLMAAHMLRESEITEVLVQRGIVIRDSLIANKAIGAGQQSVAGRRIEWSASLDLVSVTVHLPDSTLLQLDSSR